MHRVGLRTWVGVLTLTTACAGGIAAQAWARPLRHGPPVDYEALAFYPDKWRAKGQSFRLHPWRGRHVVFLTTRSDLEPAVMGPFVRHLDAGWKVYADLFDAEPKAHKHLGGKTTIAAVPDPSFIDANGRGFLGLTGIEIAAFYSVDYAQAVQNANAFSHYYFYEMGRNWFLFGDRHSHFTTGYAVFMRYVCMDTLGLEDPDRATRTTIESCEQRYVDSQLAFLAAFTNAGRGEKTHRLRDQQGRTIVPSDQPVIYAAAMLKLWKEQGGNRWLRRFFAALMRCPEFEGRGAKAATKQSLSWLVSASLASKEDLTPIFVDRWRMPISPTERAALGRVRWSGATTDPGRILADLEKARRKAAAR